MDALQSSGINLTLEQVPHLPMIAISYRREDSLPIAGRLYDRLQAKFGKPNVFMDFDSIRPGLDFREQIKETIERSKVVIAIIGPHWLGERGDGFRRIDEPSDLVRLEIAYALKRGIPVIPVLLNDTPMPNAERLPPDIEALAFRHALPLDSGLDFHQHADRLIGSIAELAKAEVDRTRLPRKDAGQSWPTEHTQSTVRRRTVSIWIALACLLIALGLGVWHFATRQGKKGAADSQTSLTAETQTDNRNRSSPVEQIPSPSRSPLPTPEPTLESRLIGKWQGPRHLIEYFPDHTFAQTGLKVDGMDWRLDGQTLKIAYPDLGKDTPAWYPGFGVFTLKIISVNGDKLITENEARLRFVEYRVTVDTPDEREGAAARAKAETKKLQADQPLQTATVVAQPTAAPAIRDSVASTASPAIEVAKSPLPSITESRPSNDKLASVHVAKIGLDVLLPTELFPNASAQLADERVDRIESIKGCAAVAFRASRDSVKNVYERCVKEFATQSNGKTIDYKVLKSTWFVVSGSSRTTGFYIKGVKHGEEVAVMELEYNGNLCNIPAPVLAEISQKFEGRSGSREVQTLVPSVPSPSPLSPNPQPPPARLNYAQGKQTLKSVYIKAVGFNVLIPTDLFPNVRRVSENTGDTSVWEKNYQVGVSFEQNTLDFDWVYRFHSSGDDALYKIRKDSWWIVQLSGTSISGGDLPRLNGMGRYIVAVKRRPDMFQMMTVWYREDHCLFTADTLKAMATSFGGKP